MVTFHGLVLETSRIDTRSRYNFVWRNLKDEDFAGHGIAVQILIKFNSRIAPTICKYFTEPKNVG